MLDHLFEYESFLNILRYYVDLNCFVIPSDPGNGERGWTAVHYHRRPKSLFDFEKKYNFKFDWRKLTDPAFERSTPKGQPLLLESLGFYDVFVPIRRRGRRLGTVLSGAFADRELTYSHLCESWSRLTGLAPSAENYEFLEFARVLLETPVLEGPVLSAYGEALQLFASLMAGGRSGPGSPRFRQLLTEVLSKHFPHSYWMDWVLGLPTAQATPIWSLHVEQMDWVRSDIGISRVPTTVLAVIPIRREAKRRNPVEEMIRVYRFQRRSFRFAQTLPQTVGGRLENYGAVFVTSADPSQGRTQQRNQILETAWKIRNFAMQELEGAVRVGIGETVAPGEALHDSYRQAVLTLHLRRTEGREPVFAVTGHREKAGGAVELTGFLLDLKKMFEQSSFGRIDGALDGFLKYVLEISLQNPEDVRWHLHYAIVQVGEAVRIGAGGAGEVQQIVEGLIRAMERSSTTQEMVLIFKEGLEKLADVARNPRKASEIYSSERVRDYLERHFRKPLEIKKLAEWSGVSPSTLSRRFKAANGMGLEAYQQKLRLGEARRLLKTSGLSIGRIARTCGFKSDAHFVRFFRRKMKISPSKFRNQVKPV
jgi:AraC-like DNA-binding protein